MWILLQGINVDTVLIIGMVLFGLIFILLIIDMLLVIYDKRKSNKF